MAAKTTVVVAQENPPLTRRLVGLARDRELTAALLAALPFLLCTLAVVDFAPIWDGRIYNECVAAALESPGSLGSYWCSDHPTMVYIAWLTLWSAFAKGSSVPIALANIALGVVGIG